MPTWKKVNLTVVAHLTTWPIWSFPGLPFTFCYPDEYPLSACIFIQRTPHPQANVPGMILITHT
ncbi:hypothetical protein HMPREF0294_1755 [Corynebacterium glucuronolyticum ATCC 51867]|nr:hypothetical protein HMPREF0294_1755 [Corynebacterium glucuronolyticum ATCC 51867]